MLITPSDFLHMKALLSRQLHERGIAIYRYCLMQNHVHLLLPLIGFEKAIPNVLGTVKQTYRRWLKRRLRGSVGHAWDNKIMWQEVQDDDYYASVVAYIENNPVKAGLVKDAVLWPWSSARAYSLGLPDPILTLDHWQATAALTRTEDMTHLLHTRRVLAAEAGL